MSPCQRRKALPLIAAPSPLDSIRETAVIGGQSEDAMKVSIVIPVYNECDNIEPLASELNAVCEKFVSPEVLFVDDGSTDDTWKRITDTAGRHPFMGGLRFDRNRGQSAALLAGFRQAKGNVLVMLDGDLQNNPKDIPRLLEKLEGCDVVCGYRANRKDRWSRRVGSRIGNTVRDWITHDGVRDTGCTLKAFRRECMDDLPPLNGMHRFMPAYFKLHGRRVEQVPVGHRARHAGRSKYSNLKRLPHTLFDLIGFVWYRRRLLTRLDILNP
jgi:dolichol-phosphate mannosyltransferase